MEAIVLEIRGRDGSLKERRRISGFPATIGRGFGNDVIIDDPYVCASHLRIESDNGTGLLLKDVSSVNGVHLPSTGAKVRELPVTTGISVRIGQTTLRFYALDSEVEPAKVQQEEKEILFGLAHFRVALLFFLLLVVLQGASGYAAAYQEERHHGLLYLLLFALALDLGCLLPWAGIWAMVSRIIVHHAHFTAHLVAATISLLTLELVLFCGKFLVFATNSSWSTFVFVYLPGICIVSLQLANHTKLSSRLSTRRSLMLAASTTVIIFGMYQAFRYTERNKFKSELPLSESLKPPMFALASDVTVDEYIAKFGMLEDQLKELSHD